MTCPSGTSGRYRGTSCGSSAASLAPAPAAIRPRRRVGGQSQFIDRPVPAIGHGATTATREWALAHLGEDFSLTRLADHAGMSVRTFTRAFREETGLTAGAWVLRARVDLAPGAYRRRFAAVSR